MKLWFETIVLKIYVKFRLPFEHLKLYCTNTFLNVLLFSESMYVGYTIV